MTTHHYPRGGAALAGLVFMLGVVAVVLITGQVFLPIRASGLTKTFTIAPGASVSEIRATLTQDNLLRSPLLFEWYVRLRGWSGKFQAGEFKIPEKISAADVAAILVSSRGASVTITIPEGWTTAEIATRLDANGVVSKQEFLQTIRKNKFAYSYRDPRGDWNLEGFLFPDTYQFRRGMKAEEVIGRMLDTFERRITGLEKITVPDILLASIVEAEVPHPADRPIVAGIFLKRLQIGMALQSDATLNYATGNGSHALSAKELAIDSPYNTYRHRGLPPTAIGNPGLDAIRAAIYPSASPYLYFLSGTDGQTHFAKTFAEQIENKKKYLRNP